MSTQDNQAVVERMWQLFAVSDWDRAGELLADDFVAEWPHSGELFRGRENFLNVQRYYPPVNWRIEVRRVIASGDLVVAEVRVPHDGGVSHVASFAELRHGKIRRLTEYWVEAGGEEPPQWRAQWAEVPGRSTGQDKSE